MATNANAALVVGGMDLTLAIAFAVVLHALQLVDFRTVGRKTV